MVAILEIGAFISSLLVGRIGDLIGRRRTILYGSLVFFTGGAFQTFATSMTLMMVGRVIAGLGVGALSTIVPVYQSEISVRLIHSQLKETCSYCVNHFKSIALELLSLKCDNWVEAWGADMLYSLRIIEVN